MYKGVIFDLDLTLVDSSIAEANRRSRNWSTVYRQIPSFTLYDGLEEVFNFITSNDVMVVIVTSSPESYARKVIEHFNIPCNHIVAFHTTNRNKPHPEPMLKALELMNLSATDVISFGDRAMDIVASNAASIKSVACLWDSSEKEQLIVAKPNFVIDKPTLIITLI